MMELLAAGIATAFAGYFFLHPTRLRLSRTELPRIRRLSDEIRRSEVHPFES
jgi:hypothetical protein